MKKKRKLKLYRCYKDTRTGTLLAVTGKVTSPVMGKLFATEIRVPKRRATVRLAPRDAEPPETYIQIRPKEYVEVAFEYENELQEIENQMIKNDDCIRAVVAEEKEGDGVRLVMSCGHSIMRGEDGTNRKIGKASRIVCQGCIKQQTQIMASLTAGAKAKEN